MTDLSAPQPDYFDVLLDVVNETLGCDRSTLTPETTFYDLDVDTYEYQSIFAQTCERTGKNLSKVVNSMPIYTLGASEWTMTSLQNLAAFSPKADQLLLRYNVREQVDTLGSVALSIEAETYVSSAKLGELAYPARTKRYVVIWSLVILIGLACIVPIAFAFMPRCTATCELPRWSLSRDVLPFFGSMAALLLAAAYVPGILALRKVRRRRG
ncbi:hypothetical protein [Octadecabacter ascidiaceicola]|uniref:Uncharacterized protein n=1 Tax=Octadecabacter ascidiaceicola TaxID=1655543 RepID=A0A238JLH6_9RHOB|nr:hypothetical protein [Octadecabacter ascidiaceicola]SMX31054.1 hypothetical protein OCA8868_00166 [Octadecabacter ascidiaceicola]